jgi:hypothetical protein
MKVASLVFGMCLFAAASSAADEPTLTPSETNTPFVDTALYLLTIDCTLPRYDPAARIHSFSGEKNEAINLVITFSNSPIGGTQAPPVSSVLTAIPVAGATISDEAPVTFVNNNCNQKYLVPGHTSLYLTIAYTDKISYTPSPSVQILDAVAGLVIPLAVFFPTGAANLLKQDASVETAMSGPFAKLLTAKNYNPSYTRSTSPLQQGSYILRTPSGKAGTVRISIDRLTSIQSALNNNEPLRHAFEQSLETLATQIGAQVGQNPAVCFTIGRTLEFNQNLSHADTVHALAQMVVWSGISSVQASNCLGTAYGPEVANDPWFKQQGGLHLANFPDIQNAVPFSLRAFTQISNAMNEYATNHTNATDLDKWFLPNITVTDTTGVIGPGKMTVEQLLDKLKAAKSQYSGYGCSEKESTFTDDNGAQDTGYILAIGKAGSPDDLLILRTWWKYDAATTNQAHVYEVNIGSDSAIVQALKDYNNECAFHVKVKAAAAAGAPH